MPWIVLFIFGGLLGEIVGQLVFYRFKFGWKTILPAVLLGVVFIPIVVAIGEMTNIFAAPMSAPSTIVGTFLLVLLTRMYNRKDRFIEKHKDTNFRPETKSLESQNTGKSGGLSPSKVPNNSMSLEGGAATPATGGGEVTGQDDLSPIDLENATDDDLHGIAWDEVADNRQITGLWGRLFVENDGDEKKTKVAYLKERVESLKVETDKKLKAREEAKAKQRAEETEELHRQRQVEENAEKSKGLERKEEDALFVRLSQFYGKATSTGVTQIDEIEKALKDGNLTIILEQLANGFSAKAIRAVAWSAEIPLNSSALNTENMIEIDYVLTVANRLWVQGRLSKREL